MMMVFVVGNFLELGEAVDLLHRGGLGAIELEVLLHDGVVVDDAVALDGERNAVDLVVVTLERERLVGQVLREAEVGEVGGVVLPGGQADGAVDVEDGGGVVSGARLRRPH